MSSDAEFSGKTVEKAVENACRQLNVEADKITYDVISRGSTGIFGIVGAKKARILVKLLERQEGVDNDVSGLDCESTAPLKSLEPTESLSGPALAGKEALEKITDKITRGVQVATQERRARISYDLKGGKAGRLIGKRGQTLEAIQYLVEKIVNRQSQERLRVYIDVSGYLKKKRQNLESLAERTARKAKKNGKPATVGQLNAHDRRIVHLALKRDNGVTTRSVGKGFLRKLVVSPKNRKGDQQGQGQ